LLMSALLAISNVMRSGRSMYAAVCNGVSSNIVN
jgi:hypothetical protein